MINTVIGTKIRQSRLFTPEGVSIPVTYIQITPHLVVQVKTKDNDGYEAVQVGIQSTKAKRLTKPELGHVKKAGFDAEPPRYLREVRGAVDSEQVKAGGTIAVSEILKAGDVVAVTGISKGKGFAGVVKRHGFRGGPRTHGQSDRERAPGSLGQTTTPGRVYKGKRMAGRMGHDRITVQNLQVISIDEEKQELVVSGLIPGSPKSVVMVKKMKG